MKVDVSGETVVGEVEIEAPPEVVFSAFTTPADLAAWWGSDETYRTSNWKVDLRPGGKWSCEARSIASGQLGTVHGMYLEVERPIKLAYTWNPSWEPGEETQVHIAFDRTRSGTLVRIVHSGFGGHVKSRQGHSEGWRRVLGWLQQYTQQKESHQ